MTTDDVRDTDWGAFTDDGPWALAPGAQPWQQDLGRVRAEVAASVPHLTRRVRLPPVRRLAVTVLHLGGAVGGWWIGAASRRGRVPP